MCAPRLPIPPRPSFRRENDAVIRSVGTAAGSAGFHMGFRFFPLQRGEADCLRILEYVLLQGETSRLRGRLLRRDLTARYLTGTLDERLSVITLKVFCLATNAIMVARSERAVLAEIERLKTNAISPEELGRAKRRYKKDYLERLSTNLGRARYLVDAVFSGRSLEALEGELNGVLGVTPQALAAGLIKVQEKIDRQSIRRVRWYQKGRDSVEIPIPVLGPDIMDPRRYEEIKRLAAQAATAQPNASAEAEGKA